MQPLPSLATLDVSGNRITASALKGRFSMLQLTELNLADNLIEELPSELAGNWPSLEILDLSKNRLQSAAELERMKPLSLLRELVVEGNPLVSQPEEMQRALSA